MAMAVTLPVLSTETQVMSDELHVTVLSSAFSGFTVAVSVSDSPLCRLREDVFKVTPVTATGFLGSSLSEQPTKVMADVMASMNSVVNFIIGLNLKVTIAKIRKKA